MLKRYGLGALMAIVFIYLVVCLFSPRNFRIQNELQIFGPPSLSYYLLNNLREWPNWISWNKTEPGIDLQLGSRDVHVGGYMTFASPKMGKGRIELMESYKDSLVSGKIISSKLPGPLLVSFQLVPESNRSIYVTLRAGLQKGIPFIKRGYYRGLKGRWEKRLSMDLEGLKQAMELAIKGDFGIRQDEFPHRRFLGMRTAIPAAKIPSFYASAYRKLYAVLDSLQIKPAGAPHGMILDWQAIYNQVYLVAAIPIPLETKLANIIGIDNFEVLRAPCLKLENYGPYSTLRNAHAKLDYFVENSELKIVQPFIEEYITDPSEEPDTNKWQTNVYYLLNTNRNYIRGFERIETQEDVDRRLEEERQRQIEEMLRVEEKKKSKK